MNLYCLALLCVGASAAPTAPNEAPLTLEKVILFSRHGIRTPYGSKAMGLPTMRSFSTEDRNWGDNTTSGGANLTLWGADVDQGLTHHGKAVLHQMGAYYASEFAALGGKSGDDITVYADFEASHRDINTAEAFLSGLLPASADVTVNAPPNLTEWLFNQGANPPSQACTLPDKTIVDGTIGGNITKYNHAESDKIMLVNDALACCEPIVCTAFMDNHDNQKVITASVTSSSAAGASSPCTLMDVPSTWNPVAFWSLYSGPISVASNLAEWAQLMYLNGLDYQSLVGAAATEADINRFYQVHQTNLDITADDVWTARSFGSDLLAHILQTMEQLFSDGSYSNPGVLSRPTDKMVYYAGHDLNIYFIRALLGLKWLTESYNPNQSPLGGMLRFELLRDSVGNPFVKIFFESQSYSQQRNASPLGGDDGAVPDRVFVSIPRCAMGPEGSCPFDVFKEIAGLALDTRCVRTTA